MVGYNNVGVGGYAGLGQASINFPMMEANKMLMQHNIKKEVQAEIMKAHMRYGQNFSKQLMMGLMNNPSPLSQDSFFISSSSAPAVPALSVTQIPI